MNGIFVSFEGGEGSGKSTQSVRFARRLEAEGRRVMQTREPGGSQGAEILREVLLSGAAQDRGPLAEAALLTAARRDHMRTVIRPALKNGVLVICDRFADSTRVYQGMVGGLSRQTIDALEVAATEGRMPDLTFVLDVPTDVAAARRTQRLAVKDDAGDRFEQEDEAFHLKVADGYRSLASLFPDRCVLIDASDDEDAVFARIEAVWRQREPGLVSADLSEEENEHAGA